MTPRELGSNGGRMGDMGKMQPGCISRLLLKSRKNNSVEREHARVQEFDFKQFYKLRIRTYSVSIFSVLCYAPYRKGQTTTTGKRNKESVPILAYE